MSVKFDIMTQIFTGQQYWNKAISNY